MSKYSVPQSIVMAWITMNGSELTGELHRPDGVNWQRKLRTVPKACAVTWVRLPRKGDLQKAQEYIKSSDFLAGKELVKIYRMDSGSDFLTLARRRVMREYKSLRSDRSRYDICPRLG